MDYLRRKFLATITIDSIKIIVNMIFIFNSESIVTVRSHLDLNFFLFSFDSTSIFPQIITIS